MQGIHIRGNGAKSEVEVKRAMALDPDLVTYAAGPLTRDERVWLVGLPTAAAIAAARIMRSLPRAGGAAIRSQGTSFRLSATWYGTSGQRRTGTWLVRPDGRVWAL